MKEKSRKDAEKLLGVLWVLFGIYVVITIGVAIALFAFESSSAWIVVLVMSGMAVIFIIALLQFSEAINNFVEGIEEPTQKEDTDDII